MRGNGGGSVALASFASLNFPSGLLWAALGLACAICGYEDFVWHSADRLKLADNRTISIKSFSLSSGGLKAVSEKGHLVVTNHAGNVVSGELGAVTNGLFVLSGRKYPLSVLPPSEQLRVKKAAGLDVRTPMEKKIDADRDYELKRIEARLREGEIDEQKAAELRAAANASAEFRKKRAKNHLRNH